MQTAYFKDNFFSRGLTEIFNEKKEKTGYLDLKSALTSSVSVCGLDHRTLIEGRFSGFFRSRWTVTNQNKEEIGWLKHKLTFTKKVFVYETGNRGSFSIVSKTFSREYRVFDAQENEIAVFEKVNGFFESSSYKLISRSQILSIEELTAVVMGVNMIEKMNNSAAPMGGAVT
ncbi:hypothetical protein ACFFJY_18215 [Fictibacillus aquaticus]|uniref:LURP-one-related family protein n=1 Tax=Fictibacillus aquaticus TaxID=2021314 RepID=A0A235F5Z8_9BACL|nr:hypothetical protein [Fictibacillus aquaticus]OYD56523.1 hypothetical protein CGZ90_16050 [Fictibacillus aquaticus]